MDDLKQLQELWQGHKKAPDGLNKKEANDRFKVIHSKIMREKRYLRFMMAGTAIVILSTIFLMPNLIYASGILLVILAMLIIYVVNEKNKAAFDGQFLNTSNQQFIERNIIFLKTRRALTARYMPWYAFFLITGINLSYITILDLIDITTLQKVGIHAGLSLFMGLGFYFSIIQHLKKLDSQINPVIEYLRSLLD